MSDIEKMIEASIAELDVDDARRRFEERNEFLALDRFLPPALVEALVAEARGLERLVHRNYMPLTRKGGFVGYSVLSKRAPKMMAAYRSPSLASALGQLAGKPLHFKPETDELSCALYSYTRWGDHLTYHYDSCGTQAGRSYTVLIGLVNQSSQRLECHFFRDDPRRATERHRLATEPGTVVFFNGGNLWHRLTRQGRNQTRIVLAWSYRTDYEMTSSERMRESAKVRMIYEGPRAVARRFVARMLRRD